MIEVMLYLSFIFTMLILLVKARFKSIGIDNIEQFEVTYLSYLLNRIVKKMVDKDLLKINKVVYVNMGNHIKIKMCLGRKHVRSI